MSATPRSARLSSPGEVVAILVASAVAWAVLIGVLLTLFFAVLIPAAQFGGRGEIPSDFPVYPGASLQLAYATFVNGCTTVDATWSSGDDASKVVAFYQERLDGGPWTVRSTTPSGGATLIRFESTSGPNREGYVQIDRAPDSTRTQITLTLVKSAANADCHLVTGTISSTMILRDASPIE